LDLNLDSSVPLLRDTSEDRKFDFKASGINLNVVSETISDNASMINKKMKPTDKEDLN